MLFTNSTLKKSFLVPHICIHVSVWSVDLRSLPLCIRLSVVRMWNTKLFVWLHLSAFDTIWEQIRPTPRQQQLPHNSLYIYLTWTQCVAICSNCRRFVGLVMLQRDNSTSKFKQCHCSVRIQGIDTDVRLSRLHWTLCPKYRQQYWRDVLGQTYANESTITVTACPSADRSPVSWKTRSTLLIAFEHVPWITWECYTRSSYLH